MRLKACIFDLDGVVVDTAKYHFIAWQSIARELGFEFTLQDNERLKGVSRMTSLDILLEVGGMTLDLHRKVALAEKKNNFYVNLIGKMTPEEVLPGVTRFLDELRKAGLRIALGSASKNARFILERTQLEHYFDVVIDGNAVSQAKPNPEVFLQGASALGIVPKACLVFEDAQAGIEAARNAGMAIIGIGEPGVLQQADHLLPGFEQMTIHQLVEWYP